MPVVVTWVSKAWSASKYIAFASGIVTSSSTVIVLVESVTAVTLDDIVESIKKYAYGVQAAFYLDGLKAHKFYFAFIEKMKKIKITS